MAGGTNSTFVLHPRGQSDLTLTLNRDSPEGAESYLILVDLGSLRFAEELRVQWTYEHNAIGAGAYSSEVVVVPLVFQAIISATSVANRAAGYRALADAVTNRRGGTVEYAPDDIGPGARTTYYHYLPSAPPRLLEEPRNRWDADQKSRRVYSIVVSVELQTLPLATSDPDTPVELTELTAATLDNWQGGGLSNQVEISTENLAGSEPALVQLTVTPASGQSLGRVIIAHRTSDDGTLANLSTVYEAEDATVIPPTTSWVEVADVSRGGGAYMRCAPAANDAQQGLRFTLQNPEDHRGRFAVFGVGYDAGGVQGVWTHQVKLRAGNVVQEGPDDYYAASPYSWQLIYAGEFELPLTEFSDLTQGYDAGPYLEWYSSRASGDTEFWLDAVIVVPITDRLGDEVRVLDVPCSDETGVASPELLLIENVLNADGRQSDRAYVVAADYDLKRINTVAPRGKFLTLDPGHDHRLIVLSERFNGVVFSDTFKDDLDNRVIVIQRFDDYTDMEVYFGIGPLSLDTDHVLEGDQNVAITLYAPTVWLKAWNGIAVDYERNDMFTDDDYIVLSLWCENGALLDSVDIVFWDINGGSCQYQFTGLATGWNFLKAKKSAFTASDIDWTIVSQWDIHFNVSDTVAVALDYLRVEKADPVGDYPNPLGGDWDISPTDGRWTITEDVDEDAPGATLACLLTSGTAYAEIEDHTMTDLRYRARLMAVEREDGNIGITWRSSVATPGVEQGYKAQVTMQVIPGDIFSAGMEIVRLTSGVETGLDSIDKANVTVGRWYTMGVMAKGSAHRVYLALTSGLGYDDDNVFQTEHLKFAFTDATFASGKCGVVVESTQGRFDEVVIESITDRVVPTDEVTLAGSALFRTVSPFDD